MSRQEKAEQNFIKIGLDCYLDALFTLNDFRRRIQRECCNALENDRPKLFMALGIKMHPKNIDFCIAEEGARAWVSAYVTIKEQQPELDSLEVGLCWATGSKGKPVIRPYAGMYFQEPIRFRERSSYFKTHTGMIFESDSANRGFLIYDKRSLPETDLHKFPEKLDGPLRELKRLWLRKRG